jgi:para-nitrobenzyl esterase
MRLIPVLLTLQVAIAGPPTVHVASGTLAGKLQGSTIVFQGIPFAAPPVGDLRWREPRPVASWAGIRDATNPGSPCMQSITGVDAFIAPLAEAYGAHFAIEPLKPSEDCLYLNVFAPLPGHGKLPAMVWLHGGSNRAGTGSGEGYDGASFASHGVIVVTINYRLGVMGFLAHPELTAESPHHSSGNYGLLDQIAALRWVQQNIEQFGGDPGNVTLFGESAGSVDATTLMASPLVKGLFRRVIAESGPAFGIGPVVTLADAQAVGKAVGTVAALRRMTAEQVAERAARVVASRFKSFDPNASVIEGWLLPQSPARAFASGSIQKVDFLAGFNGRELSAFRIVAEAAAKQSAAPQPKEPATAAVRKLADAAYPLYGGWTDMAVAVYLAQILVHGDIAVDRASNDMLVACPVGAEIALVTKRGARAFLYRFDRSIPGKGEQKLGAFHALELPFVFNTFTSRSWRWLPVTEADRKLSATMEIYWTNFARSGDPNAPGLPIWKAWNSDEEPFLEFTPTAAAVPKKNFAPPFCHLAPRGLQERLGGGR